MGVVCDTMRYVVYPDVFKFFVSLSENWYNYNVDALSVCKEAFVQENKKTPKNIPMQHLNRKNIFTPLQMQSLNYVFQMFKDMSLTTETASALVKVLCSDKTISQETRSTLMSLHHRYVRLRELITSTNNYEFDEGILQTNIDEIGLQFRLCLLKLLPISTSLDDLTRNIAQYQMTIDRHAMKRDMLQISQFSLDPLSGGTNTNKSSNMLALTEQAVQQSPLVNTLPSEQSASQEHNIAIVPHTEHTSFTKHSKSKILINE